MEGNPRQSRKLVSHLDFDFTIESIGELCSKGLPHFMRHKKKSNKQTNKNCFRFLLVCLPDSILAFHKNGMQGRSLKNGEITQEISDMSRTYRLLGSDKYVLH